MTTQSSNDDGFELNKMQQAGEFLLSEMEKDALGEIGNICMGTSATTLSTLLGRRVTITTPRVRISRGNEYLDEYENPIVQVEVSYKEGLNGSNTFLLKKEDALLISNLLMGGDGSIPQAELDGLYLSAISEVMNQMVGSSSTALAHALNVQINIAPPQIKELDDDDKTEKRHSEEVSIVISFKMEMEGLLSSSIMQIIPYSFGKQLANSLYEEEHEQPKAPEVNAKPTDKNVMERTVLEMDRNTRPKTEEESRKPVDLKTAKFESFDDAAPFSQKGQSGNIDLIIDVPLQVTVVLGKSRKSIKEILELNMGSIIVLDKIAGEMVDVLVNGKLFARGEVVVIDDNYGVRITEITGKPGEKTEQRLTADESR